MQLTAASRIKFRGTPLATQLPQGQRSRSPQGYFSFIILFLKRPNKQYRFLNSAANNIGFKTCNVLEYFRWELFILLDGCWFKFANYLGQLAITEQWVLFCGAALIFSMCYRYHLTIKLKDSRK
jgi:hypothetical protein